MDVKGQVLTQFISRRLATELFPASFTVLIHRRGLRSSSWNYKLITFLTLVTETPLTRCSFSSSSEPQRFLRQQTLAIFLAYVPWDAPNNNVKHVTFPMNIANGPPQTWLLLLRPILQTQRTSQRRQLHRSPALGRWHRPRCLLHVYGQFHYQKWPLPPCPGVSCGAVNFHGTYANTYNLEYNLDVCNIEGTTWTGTAIDRAIVISTHIETFMLPSGVGTSTLAGDTGFVEYFLDPGRVASCRIRRLGWFERSHWG